MDNSYDLHLNERIGNSMQFAVGINTFWSAFKIVGKTLDLEDPQWGKYH